MLKIIAGAVVGRLIEMIAARLEEEWAKVKGKVDDKQRREKAILLARLVEEQAKEQTRIAAEARMEPCEVIYPATLRQLRTAARQKIGIDWGAMSRDADPDAEQGYDGDNF